MQPTPHSEASHPSPARKDAATISRRTLAKGAAWAAPTVLLAAPAPAAAASVRDVIVATASCSNATFPNDNIPFTVQTVNGATLPVGTVFTVNYAGGSNRPTPLGDLANNSNAVFQYGNDTSGNGGRYGTIRLTLTKPMPANTTWSLNILMDIGALIVGEETRLTLSSSIPDQNRDTSNDTAAHRMRLGGCGS